MNKINSYIGFAKKSRTIVFGEDNCEDNKKIKLVVYSDEISQNFIKKLTKINAKAICVDSEQYNHFDVTSKVFAITNAELAKAIEKELTNIGGNDFDNKQ